MVITYPTDPLVTGLAGIAAGVLLGVGGARAVPRVFAAARAARASVTSWRAARQASLNRRVRAAEATPALPSAEVLAAIIAAVRAELGKPGPSECAPVVATPVASVAAAPDPTAPLPVRSADPWIVR